MDGDLELERVVCAARSTDEIAIVAVQGGIVIEADDVLDPLKSSKTESWVIHSRDSNNPTTHDQQI